MLLVAAVSVRLGRKVVVAELAVDTTPGSFVEIIFRRQSVSRFVRNAQVNKEGVSTDVIKADEASSWLVRARAESGAIYALFLVE